MTRQQRNGDAGSIGSTQRGLIRVSLRAFIQYAARPNNNKRSHNYAKLRLRVASSLRECRISQSIVIPFCLVFIPLPFPSRSHSRCRFPSLAQSSSSLLSLSRRNVHVSDRLHVDPLHRCAYQCVVYIPRGAPETSEISCNVLYAAVLIISPLFHSKRTQHVA